MARLIASPVRLAALLLPVVAVGISLAGTVAHAEQSASEPSSADAGKISPAQTALQRMREHLVATKTLDLATRYSVVDSAIGTKSSGKVRYLLRKPNLVRVTAKTADGRVEIYSDGKILTVHMPGKREYRRSPAGADILENLYKAAGVLAFPTRMFDFFWSVDFIERFDESAEYSVLDTETIGGQTCDGYGVQYSDDVWRVWLDRSDKRLPCRLISRRTDTSGVSVQTNTFSWKDAPAIDAETFTFIAPKGHKEVGLGDYLEPGN